MPASFLHCLGLNHRTAPVQIREVVALDDVRQRQLLAECGERDRAVPGRAKELTVLSTCNRVELYAVLETDSPDPLRTMLAESGRLADSILMPHLYHLRDVDAARHLLRVAAGLDSLVVGEPQILGQVAEAHRLAMQLGAAGPILSRVFQTAIHAGKRARAETTISRNPATVGSLAVALAAREVADLAAAQVLVIGAGEMAELMIGALRKRRVTAITVLNRTPARARELAVRWQATFLPFRDLEAALREADIVLSSTGAPRAVVHADSVRRAMQDRQGRPLVLIDIAVPRDVDPAVGDLPGVRLHDLDRLQTQVAQAHDVRERQIPRVEALIEEELADFSRWLTGLSLTPVIAAVHRKADAIRRRELAIVLRRLSDLDQRQVRRIEAFSRAIVKKLLHDPTMSLKEASGNGDASRYAALASHLFALEEDAAPREFDGPPPGVSR